MWISGTPTLWCSKMYSTFHRQADANGRFCLHGPSTAPRISSQHHVVINRLFLFFIFCLFAMVLSKQKESWPLLRKEPQLCGVTGRLARGKRQKFAFLLGAVLVCSALITLSRVAVEISNEERPYYLEEDEDDDSPDVDMRLYATACCSPKDVSCCHATSSSPWIDGVPVVDISKTCKSTKLVPSHTRTAVKRTAHGNIKAF